MLAKCIISVALAVAVFGMLVKSNPYGPTYNDGAYEQQAPSYQQPAAPAYHQPSYQPAAPAYHAAPAYPKYNAPSSAHHTQYDNYYPKQSYEKPVYAPAKPMYQPAYSAPKPAYPAAAAYGSADMDEYKA